MIQDSILSCRLILLIYQLLAKISKHWTKRLSDHTFAEKVMFGVLELFDPRELQIRAMWNQ
jgi:hypothetical protein